MIKVIALLELAEQTLTLAMQEAVSRRVDSRLSLLAIQAQTSIASYASRAREIEREHFPELKDSLIV